MKTKKPILIIDDDELSRIIMIKAIEGLQLSNNISTSQNGEDALQFLNNPKNEKPGLILLDLNMPVMDGFEFLKVIKADEDLKKIPVVIFSTSDDQKDILKSFGLQVAGYMVKPFDYNQLSDLLKTLDSYWTLSRLPR
jgi:CheY-like chemotaxis protein